MKKQYRFVEFVGFQWMIQLYHNGEYVESRKLYVDEVDDAEETLLAEGYTYGYTEEEVAEAKEKYEKMLSNIIQ